MISETNFQHIVTMLNRLLFRPVFVICGDNTQQQPFEKTNPSTCTVTSPLNNQAFLSSTYSYTLKGQHRVGDTEYLAFLDHIRNWIPNQLQLSSVQEGCIICLAGIVDHEKSLLHFNQIQIPYFSPSPVMQLTT